MASTSVSPAIYVRCSSGFGNKVFDLISAIYLKNKYNINVYFAVDRSIHDKPDDPFFGNVFYKSYLKVKYIYMKKYYHLKKTLPIEEQWIDDLDKLPAKITINIRFGGLYRFAYLMYSSFSEEDKKLFEINPKLLDPRIQAKYIDKKFACVHIRYGDKLCFALEEFKQTKYTPYMLPVYVPQYYIDQITELLTEDLDEILVMTDSIDLVKKYVTSHFRDNPKIVLFDSHYLDSFYLLTKAIYIILSHSTFSFAAAYFNPLAVCYLLKKYMMDPQKDFIYEDEAISPKWIIIDNKQYLLNFNQELLKKMIIDYANCNKYISTQPNQPTQKGSGKKIVNEVLEEDLITNGPIIINDTNITGKLVIYGTATYNNVTVNGQTNIFGTLYGQRGLFRKLNVNGHTDIKKTIIKKFLGNGKVYADDLRITHGSIIGPIYLSNSDIKSLEIISDLAEFITCRIDKLVIHNANNYSKNITIRGSTVDNIKVEGDHCIITASIDSKFGYVENGTVEIVKE